jgi:hypothetical protein
LFSVAHSIEVPFQFFIIISSTNFHLQLFTRQESLLHGGCLGLTVSSHMEVETSMSATGELLLRAIAAAAAAINDVNN